MPDSKRLKETAESWSDAPACSMIRCDTLLCGTPALWIRFRPGSAKTKDDVLGRKCALCYERNQMQYYYPESGWEMISQNVNVDLPDTAAQDSE